MWQRKDNPTPVEAPLYKLVTFKRWGEVKKRDRSRPKKKGIWRKNKEYSFGRDSNCRESTSHKDQRNVPGTYKDKGGGSPERKTAEKEEDFHREGSWDIPP